MISQQRVVVVLPAYNAAKTLEQTYRDIPMDVVDEVILGVGALAGGMPRYKYVDNWVLTLIENLVLGLKLSEYHTGYRGFRREVLARLPLGENSDDFVFDNEILAQAALFGYRIGELSCPARYFADASSINFRRSVLYDLGVVWTCLHVLLHRSGIWTLPLFSDTGRKVLEDP